MENASKALLIAAAILVVIVLIAFGMSVLNSTSGIGDQASATGTELSGSTNEAANAVTNSLLGLSGYFN